MSTMPDWLETLTDAAAGCLTLQSPAADLGVRFREVDGVWDVLLYPLPVEMIGGAHDGGVAAPAFTFDLHALLPAFEKVDAVGWDAHGTLPADAEVGPCQTVEGTAAGKRVWLRVLAYAPDDVAPAAKVDGTGRQAG